MGSHFMTVGEERYQRLLQVSDVFKVDNDELHELEIEDGNEHSDRVNNEQNIKSSIEVQTKSYADSKLIEAELRREIAKLKKEVDVKSKQLAKAKVSSAHS